jgi:hypothetical protein
MSFEIFRRIFTELATKRLYDVIPNECEKSVTLSGAMPTLAWACGIIPWFFKNTLGGTV